MKKILTFLLLSISLLAKTYMGVIDSYEIQMNLDIAEDRSISGEYFYLSSNIPMDIKGRKIGSNLYLEVYINGAASEKFELSRDYLYDFDEEWLTYSKNDEVERYIGYWYKSGKKMTVDIRDRWSDFYHPTDDRAITETEMKVFTDKIFNEYTHININDEYMIYKDMIEFDGKDSILSQLGYRELDTLVEEIRGISPYATNQFEADNKTLYDFAILSLSYRPLYQPSHIYYYHDIEDIKRMLLRWSLKSEYNRGVYLRFQHALDEFILGWEVKVMDNFNYTQEQLMEAMDILYYTIYNRAAGAFPEIEYTYINGEYREIYDYHTKISPFLDNILSYGSEREIYNLYMKANEVEALEGLKAVLLTFEYEPSFVVKLLESKGYWHSELFLESMNSFDYAKVIYEAFEEEIDIDMENAFGKTPLFYAVQYDNLDVVKFLIDKGANINKKYYRSIDIDQYTYSIKRGRRTVFMHATMHSSLETMRYLVEKGAFVFAQDELGDTAIAYTDDEEKIEYLRSLGL